MNGKLAIDIDAIIVQTLERTNSSLEMIFNTYYAKGPVKWEMNIMYRLGDEYVTQIIFFIIFAVMSSINSFAPGKI